MLPYLNNNMIMCKRDMLLSERAQFVHTWTELMGSDEGPQLPHLVEECDKL